MMTSTRACALDVYTLRGRRREEEEEGGGRRSGTIECEDEGSTLQVGMSPAVLEVRRG
jgi:hypothetical protein